MHFRLPLAFLAAYLALDWVSYLHPLQQSNITPWNPQPALAVGLLALAGQRWLPLVFLSILTAEWTTRGLPLGLPSTLLASFVLTLGYGAIASALTGTVSGAAVLDSRRGLVRLIGVVAAGTFITGALYVAAMWAVGGKLPGAYFPSLMRFWIADCVGVLVTLPLLLIWADPAKRREFGAAFREPVFYLQGALTLLALWVVFGPAFMQPFKFFYVLFLPLVWIAVRFGLVGAATAVVAIQGGVILAAQLTSYSTLTVFEFQALLIAVTVTGLFLGVTVDERRRMDGELKQSLRLAAAGEMSAALAHELNQPLAALGNYARASLLLARAPEVDRAQLGATLEKMLAESDRAADVVRRLRDFFRTGATHLEVASLARVAEGVIGSLQPKAGDLGIAIESRVDARTGDVLIDPLQIEVVLRNLVANGVEAAREGSSPRSVVVEIAPGESGFVRAMVRDSGKGVAPELRERIFEPFWSSRATGMGMGLAISRAIVEAHGGRIWAEAGEGGTFGFTLPVAHA